MHVAVDRKRYNVLDQRPALVRDLVAVDVPTPTIGDIIAIIDAKFISGTCDGIIECPAEADVNRSGGSDPACDDITIGDIALLVDYLFITGPTLGLPDCP